MLLMIRIQSAVDAHDRLKPTNDSEIMSLCSDLVDDVLAELFQFLTDDDWNPDVLLFGTSLNQTEASATGLPADPNWKVTAVL
jgi:hypothetical protein